MDTLKKGGGGVVGVQKSDSNEMEYERSRGLASTLNPLCVSR